MANSPVALTDIMIAAPFLSRLLLGASVLSWALMYEKRGYIRQSQAEARDFEGRFWSGLNLSDLFSQLSQREERRYEITHVPAPVRNRDRLVGVGEPVLARYERIAFQKDLIAPQGQPLAAFVCPGHPLLDAALDLTLAFGSHFSGCHENTPQTPSKGGRFAAGSV